MSTPRYKQKRQRQRSDEETGARDVTYHSVTWHVTCGDAECRVLVVFVSVDVELPVVDTAWEAHGAEHDAVVEAAARRREVVVGKKDVVMGGRRIETERRHYIAYTRITHHYPLTSDLVVL